MPIGYYRNQQYNLDLDPDSIQTAIEAFTDISAYCHDKAQSANRYPEKIGRSWTGLAATAAKKEMLGWSAMMDRSQLRLGEAVTALKKYKTDISDIKSDLKSLNKDYENLKYSHSNTSIQPNEVYTRLAQETPAEKWASAQKACDHRFSILTEQAETAARALAKSLTEAVLVPIPRDLHANQCLGPTAEQQIIDITYTALLKALPLAAARTDAGYGSELSAIEAEAKAEEWSVRLQSIGDNPTEDISAAELATLKKYSKDPRFSAALLRILGVEKYVDITQKIAAQPQTRPQSYRPGVPVAGQKEFELSRIDLLKAMAATLGTASHDPEFPTDTAEKLLTQAKQGNGPAVEILLTFGGPFARTFCETLAEKIYAAEQAEPNPGSANTGPYPLFDRAPRGLRQTTIAINGLGTFGDPLAGALTALSAHPRAAQLFLLAKDSPAERTRLNYLTATHSWTTDHGQALGSIVIAAAATIPKDETPGSPGADSYLVTREYLAALPYRKPGNAPEYYDIPAKAKASVALVLAVHDDQLRLDSAVHDMDIMTGETQPTGGTQPAFPDQKLLLQAVVSDSTALKILLAGRALNAQNALVKIGEEFQAAKTPSELDHAKTRWANALLNERQYTQEIAEAIQRDAKARGKDMDAEERARLNASQKGIVSSLSAIGARLPAVPVVGLPAGIALTLSAETIGSQIVDVENSNLEGLEEQKTTKIEETLQQ